MKEMLKGSFAVEIFEGKVLLHLSTEDAAMSILMLPEGARKLSSALFTKYVEAQEIGVRPQ